MNPVDVFPEFDRTTPIFCASEVWSIVTVLAERGVDVREALTANGLSLAAVADASKRVSLDQIVGVHRYALERLPFGELEREVGHRQHLTAYGMVGFAMMCCPTLEQALIVSQRFWPLINAKFHLRYEVIDANVRIYVRQRFSMSSGMYRPTMVLELVKLLVMLRDLLGEGFTPASVSIADTHPEALEAIRRSARCRIVSGKASYVEFAAPLLKRPLMQAHRISHRASLEHCERLMSELQRFPPLVQSIREHLTNLEDGAPLFEEVASRLAMSARTLRRRLQDLDTSYNKILEEVRYSVAKSCLRDQLFTTDAIAERLGYTETSNFRHAFKRWAGLSPQQFRESALSAASMRPPTQRVYSDQHAS